MSHISEARVLLLDGRRHLRHVLVPVLRHMGLREIFVAEGVEDGVGALPSRNPDLIFVDHDPAPNDALDFVRYARIPGRGWSHDAPLFLMAEAPERRLILAARDAGVNEILIKPVSTAIVADRVMRALFNPRPFVDDPSFRGPDRRRARGGPEDTPARRREDRGKALS